MSLVSKNSQITGRSYIIVDDAPFVHEIIKSVLMDTGMIFLGSAYSGNEVGELVKRVLPDILFLDIVLPFKSGITVSKEAKEIWPEIKIIGMSTLDNEKIITEALGAGIDIFMGKPFTREKIYQVLDSLVLQEKDKKLDNAI